MRTSLVVVVGKISLLLAVLFFVIFVIFENYMMKKEKNPMYLNKIEESLFILVLFFSSIFAICFFMNTKNMISFISHVFKVIFKA